MNTRISIETTDKTALAIFRSAFPGTNFRSVTVTVFRGPMTLASYWSGGFRDYFAIVPIDVGSGKVASVRENGSGFTGETLALSELPAGFALACHSYGPRARGTLYVAAENVTPMLPAPGPVSPWVETAVLACVCSLKAFARREQAARLGIGAAEYDATIAALKAKRLLSAVGGATPEGRNVDSANRGESIQWHWAKLAMAGDRDSDEKRSAERMAAYYASANASTAMEVTS